MRNSSLWPLGATCAADRAEIKRLHDAKIAALARGEDAEVLDMSRELAQRVLADDEAALGLAQAELERAQAAVRRHDDHAKAAELERLAGQLTADRKASDEAMRRLAELFRAEAATRARIGALDRGAAEELRHAFRNFFLPRMACIKAGLPSFVPVDHVANSRGGVAMASWPENGLHARIAALRGGSEERAA
jgi:hypothetical protein